MKGNKMAQGRGRIRIQRSRRLRHHEKTAERSAILPLDPKDPDVAKAKLLGRRG
jgi:hypothetical protein